jgi:hypothetical protein
MGGCVSLVELDYIDCETLQKHTFEIDMGGPISLDVLDDAFATVVQRRIVSVADADARRIEIQKRRGQWWEVFVVFVIWSLFLVPFGHGLLLVVLFLGIRIPDQCHFSLVNTIDGSILDRQGKWNWEVGGCQASVGRGGKVSPMTCAMRARHDVPAQIEKSSDANDQRVKERAAQSKDPF